MAYGECSKEGLDAWAAALDLYSHRVSHAHTTANSHARPRTHAHASTARTHTHTHSEKQVGKVAAQHHACRRLLEVARVGG